MLAEKKRRPAVLGIYETRSSVGFAVDQLKLSGFRNSDISVLMPTHEGSEEFAQIKKQIKNTRTPEEITAAAAGGALLGGSLGWLVGMGSLAIPGVGPFIAAGPIMASLAGMGVGGAVGGIAGALVGSGIPEPEAKRFEGSIKTGGILLSVHVDDHEWMHRAKEVLIHTGGKDIAMTSQEKDFPGLIQKSQASEDFIARKQF